MPPHPPPPPLFIWTFWIRIYDKIRSLLAWRKLKQWKSFKNGYAHLRANMVESTWYGAGSINRVCGPHLLTDTRQEALIGPCPSTYKYKKNALSDPQNTGQTWRERWRCRWRRCRRWPPPGERRGGRVGFPPAGTDLNKERDVKNQSINQQ